MNASLWPPPAKCIATSGFQPTRAAAKARRLATSHVVARTDNAALARRSHAATGADRVRPTGRETSENAGPYGEVSCRYAVPAYRAATRSSDGVSVYGSCTLA
jgi:hypothetical protein